MKRYAVFSHQRYYPQGGWYDCRGLFETIEEAMQVDIGSPVFGGSVKPDSAYIVDLETEKQVRMLDYTGVWADTGEDTTP